ncbi:hypothetical protein G9P44_004579 [Scheffersomyces stipitis]|nr:hypothetical protein G9P44_004579 [Scheffersomyces stipitis]
MSIASGSFENTRMMTGSLGDISNKPLREEVVSPLCSSSLPKIRSIYIDGQVLPLTSTTHQSTEREDLASPSEEVSPYSFSITTASSVSEEITQSAINSAKNFNPNAEASMTPFSPLAGSTQLTSAHLQTQSTSFSFPRSTPDLKSPYPETSFSPKNKNVQKSNYRMSKLVEELLETEEKYIISMKVLQNFYLETFAINKKEVPVPIQQLKFYLSILITTHDSMLKSMKEVIEKRTDLVANIEEIAQLVAEKGICTHIYSEYCNVFEGVLKIIRDNKLLRVNEAMWDSKWIKGWETYLEATQPGTKHMDLSFYSLIQRPVARIGKYKLMIESLTKCSIKKKLSLESIYWVVRSKLNYINNVSKEFKGNEINDSVNLLVDFSGIETNMVTSSQFFGSILQIGAIASIWVEDGKCIGRTLAAFLYKSHLLLVDFAKVDKSKKHEIKFLVPLSKCALVNHFTETDGGLFCSLNNTIKIIFEKKFWQYEILFVFINSEEKSIWSNYLHTLINEVNGPYPMNYKDAQREYLCVHPPAMDPYDINLLYLDYNKHKHSCYFKDTKCVHVISDFGIENQEPDSIFMENSNGEEIDIRSNYGLPWQQRVTFKKFERIATETKLKNVWSRELPTIYVERPSLLRKSASWSAIRIDSFKSYRSFQDHVQKSSDSSCDPPHDVPQNSVKSSNPPPRKSISLISTLSWGSRTRQRMLLTQRPRQKAYSY